MTKTMYAKKDGIHVAEFGKLPYMDKLKPNAIWALEQNKPKLVARDLEAYGVPQDVTHAVLLARGVYKWLNVRRMLIKLKNEWRERITEKNRQLAKRKPEWLNRSRDWHKGYLAAMEDCRAQVRALCHSERWAAPDLDRDANDFLERMGRQ